MGIRTLSTQEKYSKNRGGGTESRRKLKKLRSVKVANLDKLRLSMKRYKPRFDYSLGSTDPSEPSSTPRFDHSLGSTEPSSTPMSGKSSPNYMKPTTCSSARKEKEKEKEKSTTLASKKNPNSMDFKSGESLKRMPSTTKRSKKISSVKSRKFRAKYSQFSDVNIDELGFHDNDDQGNDMIKEEETRKAIMERSRSIKMTRLKSIRLSRRRPKSILGGGEEPHYMKGTSSQEARTNSAKGLIRTSSFRPLRILAKIPSLRQRRSRIRKPPEVSTPKPGISVDRATCSSMLKSSKFTEDHNELHSEGTSSFHACPYNYCSLHGHHHHGPSPPVKEFISAKKQMLYDHKGKQLKSPMKEVEDIGIDYRVEIYPKSRKKWEFEGISTKDDEALNQINVRDNKELYDISNDSKCKALEPFIEEEEDEVESSLKESEDNPGGDLINIFSDKEKYTNIWHLIYQQFVSSEASMAANLGIHNKNINEYEDNQDANMKKVEFDQTAAVNLVQEALDSILQGEEIVENKTSLELENNQHEVEKSESNEGKMARKLRKMIMTTKFIKAMERLRKISPRKPQNLSPEPISEEERVYLRHLSMNQRKNDDGWMLDYALRQVISRMAPDKQRRVALLVEAFETVGPHEKVKDIRCYPVKGERAPGIEFDESKKEISVSDEQVSQKQDNGVSVSHRSLPEERTLREDRDHQESTTGDKILQLSDETGILDSTLEIYTNSSKSTSVDTEIEESGTLEVPSQFSAEISEVPRNDTNTNLFEKRKYTRMWNLIYQHVISSENSIDGKQGVDEFDEKEQVVDLDSTQNTWEKNQEENEDNQSAPCEKHEFDQSAAINLVKEAVNSLLQNYEQSTDQKSNSKEVEHNVLKTPYSRLKKAILMTKFIKTIERLRKISPQKSHNLYSKAATEEERVYLRRLSVDGKKNEEEWMLDYALRQVISKLAPDEQRKVAQLIEAFETVTPDQKEKGTSKKTSTRFFEFEQERSMCDQHVPQKQDDDGVQLSGEAVCEERSLQDDYDHPMSTTDDNILQDTDEATFSASTLELSEDSLTPVRADVACEKPSVEDAETMSVSPAGDMANILSDKQKYTCMWHLIYQHATSGDTSMAANGVKEMDEDEKIDNANKSQETNDFDSKLSNQSRNHKEEEDNQITVSDQSAAIKLVKEAINAILQSHEQKSDQQSVVENHRIPEPEDEQVEPNEEKPSHGKMSKSLSRLKRLFVTAKFIKAMERLRKMSPRKPRHLSPQESSEKERVCLRHLSMNGRKNDEEWMLDYALRKVISNLAPDQQRKVALLVEAFETVTPPVPAIELDTAENEKGMVESKHDNSTSYDDQSIKVANSSTVLSDKVRDSDGIDLLFHRQSSPKGSPDTDPLDILTVRKEEKDCNPMSKSVERAGLSENPESGCDDYIAKDILSDKQNNNKMWHLIYQHVKTATGNKLSERVLTNEDQMNSTFVTIADVDDDDDDSDASSLTSDLTEKDAIKLVKEAVNDILEVPQELDNDLLSSKEDRREEAGEKPKKGLSRGYSKLRKLIICNKFIKAMEKPRKIHQRKLKTLGLNSEPKAEKAQLKPCSLGERKGMDEWMLDNALQKVIAELAPVQQRRVALLVKAFEKVNPDIEEKDDNIFELSRKSSGPPNGFNLELDRSITTSSTPSLSEENPGNMEDWKNAQENELNVSIENGVSLDREKYTSLWGLILQHAKSDISEKTETPIPCEIDANMLPKTETDDNSQISRTVNHEKGTDVQSPQSTSLEFQENEAIKLVQEAVDEILLLPDQEIEIATPEGKKTSTEEKLPNSYYQLSKVILCKRFIKAMDKMRKLKPQSPQYISQPPHSEDERIHSLRQRATIDGKSWEEGMLDHALQKVIGKLAPAKKKRVAMLVQAFETVGS